MLLAVDMGNTDIVVALHDGKNWIEKLRSPTAQIDLFKENLLQWMENSKLEFSMIKRSIFSSVVPDKIPPIQKILKEVLQKEPLIMGPWLFDKISLLIDNPNEIGSDLVANAFAAFHKYNQAAVVVDFGTALSFTVVSDKGEILGVSIAPGLKTSMRALFSKTAQLNEVPLKLPETAIGKNTAHALQSGILLGYVGLVKEILKRVEEELGKKPKIIATGGLVSVMTPLHTVFDEIDPMHTLEGLRFIAEKFQ